MQHQHFKTDGLSSIFCISNTNERATKAQAAKKGATMSLIQNYRNWRRYRETVNELSRLSNRELNDLGIARGEIPSVARRAI